VAATLLRSVRPVLRIGGRTIVTRHEDVREVLERADLFGVTHTNGQRMDALGLSFILGMDPGTRYERERSWLDAAVQPEDLPRLRADVRAWSEELLGRADPSSFDISSEYARMVGLRLAQAYLGVPGPDAPSMLRWMRTLFRYLFLDLGNDAEVRAQAAASARELEHYLLEWIEVRRAEIEDEPSPDDILSRLLRHSDAGKNGLDSDGVRRSISGLLIGAVETTNAAFCYAIDELLRRPRMLAAAKEAARAADVEAVGEFVFEALRFRPHNPVLVRTAKDDMNFASGAGSVRAGDTVFASNLSAMFDARVFYQPGAFRTDRSVPYMHFGGGMHVCYGSAINRVTLPEMATVLLRRPGLRRDGWLRGQVHFDGPFPDQLRVRFRR
jgi:cytochrome P450